jgi:putative transposase
LRNRTVRHRRDAYDNALCESFFANLECELLARVKFRAPVDARPVLFEFIESWYNRQRRHSALGYVSPLEFEAQDAVHLARSA